MPNCSHNSLTVNRALCANITNRIISSIGLTFFQDILSGTVTHPPGSFVTYHSGSNRQSSLLTQRHHPELADGFGVVHSVRWERTSQLDLCKRKAIHFKLIYPRGHPRVHREINHPRKLDAQLARHGSPLPARAGNVNSED